MKEAQQQIKSMLFLSLEGLGDSILNLPILKTLEDDYSVKVLCKDNGTFEFLRNLGFDAVGVKSRWEIIKMARKINPDILFVPFPTWKKELAAALVSKAHEKIYYSPVEFSWGRLFRGYADNPDPEMHIIENSIKLLKLVPQYKNKDVCKMLNLKWMIPPSVISNPWGSVLAIHPTGSTEAKYYPPNFWKELWSILRNSFDEIHVFCGRHEPERSYCQSLVKTLGERARLFAGLPFSELATHLNAADYFIGSESALLHLCAVLDKPVLGLWCHGNIRVFYPYGNQSKVYVPNEILSTHDYEYPPEVPAYVKRASAEQVAAIVQDRTSSSFQIKPLYKNHVHCYLF